MSFKNVAQFLCGISRLLVKIFKIKNKYVFEVLFNKMVFNPKFHCLLKLKKKDKTIVLSFFKKKSELITIFKLKNLKKGI